MTTQQKFQQLQEEANALSKTIKEKDKIIEELRQEISDLYYLIDLLQSFIPERGKWRSIFCYGAN